MAGASPILGIPYPDLGDVADGPDGFKDIADRLDALVAAGVLGLPAGAMAPYAGAAAPTGWLLCQGQAVDRTVYAALFAAIGTTYGAGNGTTTFNLPDMQGRVACGAGTPTGGAISAGAAAIPYGQKGGQQKVLLGIPDIPAHGHGTVASTTESGGHTHSGTTGGADRSLAHDHPINDQGHSHGAAPGYSFLIASALFGVSAGSGGGYSGNTHIGPTQGAFTGITGTAGGGAPDHLHAFTTGDRSSVHTHNVTVPNTGGGGSHENMSAYTGVNYIIKT